MRACISGSVNICVGLLWCERVRVLCVFVCAYCIYNRSLHFVLVQFPSLGHCNLYWPCMDRHNIR